MKSLHRSRAARRTVTLAALCSTLSVQHLALAAPGPGIGNLDCGDAEYFEPFSFIENRQGPNGTNVALMIRGYFMTIFAPDSGRPPGEIGIYDVSDPKAPVEVRHIENADTNLFREAHSLPVALMGDKQYVAVQTISGIQIWDFTDPLAAARIGSIDLPGVNGGDYEDVAWQTSWQGRYLYVAGGNRGIYVVDTADPTNPRLLNQVPTSASGGFRVGPLFALGDYLVISNMDQGGAYAVLDISDPERPALLGQERNLPRMYAITVGGQDRIYSAGRDGDFLTHSFSDPTELTEIKRAPIGQDQLYVAAQDDHIFLGRQNNFVKVDVTDEQNPRVIGEGELGRGHPDHGQVTPLGNLIFIGNDHGTGSAFFCHQRGRDTQPPEVESTYPKDGSTWMTTNTRVSVLFSDYIDTETLTPENVVLRKAGGAPLDGIITYNFNTLSFGPDAPLEPDTTYELVLPAGGIQDVMGNALDDELLLRFSTGESIEVPPDGPDPSTGGAGGAGAGSGGGSSGGVGGMSAGGTSGSSTGGGGAIASGGTSASGGAPSGGTGARPSDEPDESGGCALVVGGGATARTGLGLATLGLALGLFRRRRRGSRA